MSDETREALKSARTGVKKRLKYILRHFELEKAEEIHLIATWALRSLNKKRVLFEIVLIASVGYQRIPDPPSLQA